MSTRRKGLSEEEKREKLKKFFHETADVYSAKDVEQSASEACGMNMIQVKETLKSLVDDGVVQTDKLGSSNFYWSFPSFELNQLLNQKEELQKGVADAKAKIEKERERIESLKIGREPTDERTKKLAQLQELKDREAQLKEELANFADVETIELMKKELTVAVTAANRNTDNIDALRAYCDKKWNITRDDFNRNFQIDPNMEYLDF
ncbi:hypothetical protein SAMD00019534_005300 [Acytostelium subglobosum LB1]|uniref:hypothetical protein n=1 Tax=Acytostelium subglobosum LB1 TaxID=1410327 RepID=UPI000644EFFD|nr:hypothetical protein SAMD00019534_005300 [Acytostelium subglobosum LB1]GAM17355.1 hypothetical protein SAMD00019534_005300 [Acytostelium subglobosum LB1]|eukprot:XP_012759417.1 hypothetical protein SAMD00019534_005300 [Acytostelium subglobosum LB1]